MGQRLRYVRAQFPNFIAQIFDAFLDHSHGLIVVIASLAAVIWSIAAVFNNTFLQEILGISVLVIIGFGLAILMHLRVRNDYEDRMYKVFLQYPRAFLDTLWPWILVFVIALVITLAMSFAIALFSLIFGANLLSAFISAFAVTVWLALGVSLLFWGIFALDMADDAPHYYGDSMGGGQDW